MMPRRGGMRVVDRRVKWDKLVRELADRSDEAVTVGVRGTPARDDGAVTNPQLAAWHEYGTSRVPARPFIRPTMDANFGKYRKMAAKLADQVMALRMTKGAALKLIGMAAVADVKARIRAHIPPPLADSTSDAKGSTTPLIDSGQLLGAITYEVGRK